MEATRDVWCYVFIYSAVSPPKNIRANFCYVTETLSTAIDFLPTLVRWQERTETPVGAKHEVSGVAHGWVTGGYCRKILFLEELYRKNNWRSV